jgi:hypothetical protein
MIGGSTRQPVSLGQTNLERRKSASLLARKIWLPKLIYHSIPYFYVVAGITALFATAYISNWLWIMPHYLLFSGACFHLGALIFNKRRRTRADND